METTYYMPMVIREWPMSHTVRFTPDGFRERAALTPDSVGYIPVYTSLEALRAQHGNVKYFEVRQVQKEAA